MRGLSRPAGVLLAGVTAVALAGCGAGTAERAAPAPHAVSPAAATAPAGASSPLAAGLLPAGAFGDGATVTPIPADQLSRVAGMAGMLGGGLGGALGGVQITQPACAAAVRQVAAQVAAVRDAAGEVARGSDTWTAELLVTTDPQLDTATLLGAVVSGCSSATVTVPQRGTATLALAAITPPGLPPGASALAVTVTAQRTGGGSFTGSGLLGLVPAGNRLLLLGQASPSGAAPDQDAFASLLAQAEADAH